MHLPELMNGGLRNAAARCGRRRWLGIAAVVAVVLFAGTLIWSGFARAQGEKSHGVALAQTQATPTVSPSNAMTATAGLTETMAMTGTGLMSPTLMEMMVADAPLAGDAITPTGDISATAQLINQAGDPVGMALFTPVQVGEDNINAVLVQVQFQGMTAAGPGYHALHIHETGACALPDFSSAGDHFNPLDAQHGFLHPDGPHAGDLPNIALDENGNGDYQWASALITLNEGERAILDDDGSALVLHAMADNYITQSSGGGGDRIACGVITSSDQTDDATEADAEANTVQVGLIEWAIEMPNELPAGPTTFVVTNQGTVEHNFEIENEEMGFEEVFAQNLAPGETMTMTVDLQPGEYYVYCPIGNHAARGMELTLTVTEGESAAAPADETAGSAAAARSEEDMAIAEDLWQQMQEANYQETWATVPGKGTFYQGQPPHGALLSTYFNPEAAEAMEAQPGEMPADAIIVKENYDADRNLVSLTVMYKEPGYDPEHMDWYWASYGPDGEVQMAGQAPGCIACHGAVRSNDYIFTVPIAPIEP